MRKFLPILLPALLFSCATIREQRAVLTDQASWEPLSPLTLDLGYDIFLQRVDLRRDTHTETEIGRDMKEREITVANDDHPLVLDLGNGLILDLNGNLCLDLMRLYGIRDLEEFVIRSEGSRIGNTNTTITVKDGKYRIERKRGSPALEQGRYDAATAEDDKKRHSVIVSYDLSVDTMVSPLGFKSVVTMKKPAMGTAVLASRERTRTAVLDAGTVRLDDGLVVEHMGNRITAAGLTFVRAGDSVFIFDRHYSGVELRRVENRVEYRVNDELVRTFTLE